MEIPKTSESRDQRDTRAWELLSGLFTDPGNVNPYDIYRELHTIGDDFVTPHGAHIVIGHAAVTEMTRNPAFKKNSALGTSPLQRPFVELSAEQWKEIEEQSDGATALLVNLDEPDHTRIRGLAQKAFLPKNVARMKDKIVETTDRLLGAIDPTKPVDIASQFGALFAPEIMAELIGLPSTDRIYISELTAIQMRAVDPQADFEVQLAAAKAAKAQRNYVSELVAARRADPRDDMVTALAQGSGETLSDAELVALLTILYIGGYETTAHMIGNGLVALLNNPDQLALLRRDIDTNIRPAVEEMLRFDGAISVTQLFPAAGATLFGRPAEANVPYLGILTAANRDPAAYDEPDRFIINRARKPIQTFGGGSHFCLGMHLAKLELELVFRTFVQRYPAMQLLNPEPPRIPLFHQQAYASVPVLLQSRA